MKINDEIINKERFFLVTGSNGFIGSKIVETLLNYGFKNIRCLVRQITRSKNLKILKDKYSESNIQIFEGNLLNSEDCQKVVENISVIFHCAAGMGCSTYPEMFLNTVVTTKNLLEAVSNSKDLKRFVNISSFAVYSNMNIRRNGLLNETCEIESHHNERYDPYSFAKIKQEQIVCEYSKRNGFPVVTVRLGAVYGPGGEAITSRVGIGTFGIFIHIGGGNRIPYTYIDNCAEAIVLAGITSGVEGEIFNIVDDNLPTSHYFLKLYKKNVNKFRSIFIPFRIFYLVSYMWEKYSKVSKGQLPPVFNRRKSAANWKGNKYSNIKIKSMLGWKQKIPTEEGLRRHFEYLNANDGETNA